MPVIALTANVMSDAREIYQNYGFSGYLSKPIDPLELEYTVLQFIPQEYVTYRDTRNDDTIINSIQVIPKKKKKPIYITTECVCDIPFQLFEEYDIGVMYYYVITKTAQFQDIKEINSDNLLKYIAVEGNYAHSTYASEKEYETFFANALEDAQQVIHLSIAKHVEQGGYANANAAAAAFDHVTVYDTGHLSSGMGLMALMAASMVQEYASKESIIMALDQMKKRVSTSFIVPNLQTLYRNDMVDKSQQMICELFDLHPILHLTHSKMKCVGFEVGSMEHAYNKYIRHLLKLSRNIDTRVVFITYSGCLVRQVEEFAEQIKKYIDFEHVILQQASASISCNCGLGAMGVIFLRK